MQSYNPLLVTLGKKENRGREKCLDSLLFLSDKSVLLLASVEKEQAVHLGTED